MRVDVVFVGLIVGCYCEPSVYFIEIWKKVLGGCVGVGVG